jgi:hypothetical protein
MKEHKLELNGMQCEACERIISRVAEKHNITVKEINQKQGYIVFAADEKNTATMKHELAEKGFTERKADEDNLPRGHPRRLKKYIMAVLSGNQSVKVETTLVNYAIGSTATLTAIGVLAYTMFFSNIAVAINYVPIWFLAIMTAIITVFSYFHVNCFRKNMSCTNGMMAGMIIGMITGFLGGAIIGATNGMFIGSVAGIIMGVAIGGNLGRCCGIMGGLEGMMAGLMAGTMGAMISVMLVNDNLVPFLYFLYAICTAILGGLSYMMYREAGSAPPSELKIKFPQFLAMSFILSAILILITLYGPRGPIVYP